jgi:hypothetical protein
VWRGIDRSGNGQPAAVLIREAAKYAAVMAKRLGWYFPEQMVLKITLLGSEPKVWREVEVHSGLTLYEFHYVMQAVFPWSNSHLFHFLVPPGGKLTRTAMQEAVRYVGAPVSGFDLGGQTDLPADEQLLGRAFAPDCKQIVYEYDFGDSWEHLIQLKSRVQGGDQDHVPVCLGGENAAPPDDSGGIPGYYMWLDALRDPSNEMHKEALEWLGKDFDPSTFDLKAANRRLAKIFKPAPKKPRKRRKKPE